MAFTLKARSVTRATIVVGLALTSSCERVPAPTGADTTVATLVVSPKTATLRQNELQDFLAVGFTASGDTARVAVVWSATGGSVDSSSTGGRHYGRYKNPRCGRFHLVATTRPGSVSDSASISVSC